jgi:hypothetical protein
MLIRMNAVGGRYPHGGMFGVEKSICSALPEGYRSGMSARANPSEGGNAKPRVQQDNHR